MLTEERTAPSLEEARSALADEWRRADPRSPEAIAQFYVTSRKLGDDLEAWHATPERQSWTKMLVHVATVSEAKVVVDLGCGAGHDLVALKDAGVETVVGVEPNDYLADGVADSDIPCFEHVEVAPIEEANLIVCIDVLEHVPDPEAFLEQSVGRAKVGAILFEATATHDHGTPLHLESNWGWHPSRWLEQHGWKMVDEAAGRVHVWEREAEVGRQTASILVCAYRGISANTHHSIISVIGDQHLWRSRTKMGDALIARSRSIIVTSWWAETGDDAFLMVDDDIAFNRGDADRAVELCRNGYDIVCGAYPLHDGSNFALKTFPGIQTIDFGPGQQPIEVMYAATGFMATSRRVIDVMVKELPLCHADQKWAFYPLFQSKVVNDPKQGGWVFLSEDWGFSQVARDLGFKIWLDPQTKLMHGTNAQLSVNNMKLMQDAIARA